MYFASSDEVLACLAEVHERVLYGPAAWALELRG
jgi:hypothetical protein